MGSSMSKVDPCWLHCAFAVLAAAMSSLLLPNCEGLHAVRLFQMNRSTITFKLWDITQFKCNGLFFWTLLTIFLLFESTYVTRPTCIISINTSLSRTVLEIFDLNFSGFDPDFWLVEVTWVWKFSVSTGGSYMTSYLTSIDTVTLSRILCLIYSTATFLFIYLFNRSLELAKTYKV